VSGYKLAASALGLLAVTAGLATFWNRRVPVSPPPAQHARNLKIAGSDAGYIDAAACAGCHSEIARTYARTGMARSFGAIRAETPANIFPDGAFHHEVSAQSFTMYRQGGRPYLKRHLTGPDGSPDEERETEVHFWLGSGNRGRSFVHRATSGKLIVLPVTWYAEGGGRWGMNPGYDRPVHTGFDRTVDYRCLSCHAGYPEIEPGADSRVGAWELPGRLVEGIDCQRCHGPGAAHVEAARRGSAPEAVRHAIINPKRLPPERQLEVCYQCHLETTSVALPAEIIRFDRGVFSYRPGQPLAEYALFFDYAKGTEHDGRFEFVSSAYRLVQSRCFRESAGAMTCTTCHNPHDIPRGEEAVRHYASVCRKCHAAQLGRMVAGQQHPAAADCVPCHMPKRTPSDAVRVRVADHFIRKHPEADPAAPLAERNQRAKPYRGEVLAYHPAKLQSTPEDELYAAVAQVTQQTNLSSGAARLEDLVKRYRPEHGEFYLQLGNAWKNLGNLDKSRRWLEEALRRMPGNWRPHLLLASTVAAAGQTERARELLRRASELAPREPSPLAEEGKIYMTQGKFADAAASFRRALQIDPDLAEVHNALGTSLMNSGDAAGAERAFREAVRLRPELPQARANLATLLTLLDRFAEAKHHFQLTLRLEPSYAAAHSAYATALAQKQLFAEARPHYEQALRLEPADPVSHQNLATVLRQLGEPEAAIREYRAAIHYLPDYFEAHLGLAEIYIARNQRTAAQPHLRKAAESPDPEVRRHAAALLSSPGS
jgi:Flp pilus assembly protein TadD